MCLGTYSVGVLAGELDQPGARGDTGKATPGEVAGRGEPWIACAVRSKFLEPEHGVSVTLAPVQPSPHGLHDLRHPG